MKRARLPLWHRVALVYLIAGAAALYVAVLLAPIAIAVYVVSVLW